MSAVCGGKLKAIPMFENIMSTYVMFAFVFAFTFFELNKLHGRITVI